MDCICVTNGGQFTMLILYYNIAEERQENRKTKRHGVFGSRILYISASFAVFFCYDSS